MNKAAGKTKGRPALPGGRITVTISLDARTFAAIERRRGPLSRSAYLRQLVARTEDAQDASKMPAGENR